MSLSRKDIKEYKSTKSASIKHALELKVSDDEFERDALDGWSNPEISLQQLQYLDRYYNHHYTKIILISTIALIIFGSIFVKNNTKKNVAFVKSDSKKIVLKQHDKIISMDTIINFVEIPNNLQIKPKQIIKEFNQKEEFQFISNTQEIEQHQDLIRLPLKKMDYIKAQESLKRENTGKETFLHDLKVIDYRFYRARPESTIQENLNGTPANRETKIEEFYEDKTTLEFTYFSYLDKSLKLFRENKFKSALNRFEIILETYPDDINALFYSSICLYNLNQFDYCEKRLNILKAARFTNFEEEQQWYLLLTLKALKKIEPFEKLKRKIIEEKGFYSKQASKIN